MPAIGTYRRFLLTLVVFGAVVGPRAWSQDGGIITFGGVARDAAYSIYVMTPWGDEVSELTRHDPANVYATDPVWSRDGRAIAFSYRFGGLERRIYRMDADGGNLSPMSDGPRDFEPAWSPGDDAVAFTSAREGSDRQGIYVNELDGTGDTLLTDPDEFAKGCSWRPAGDVIAYQLSDDRSINLHTMDRRGRPLAQLTQGLGFRLQPNWHPLGAAITFAYSSGDDDINVHTKQADGSDERQVTKHRARDWYPCWSPDGTEVLFMSYRDGSDELYIVGAGGENLRRVTFRQFRGFEGFDWFDPDHLRSVSPVGRRATTWGWIKRLGKPNS